MNKGEIRKGILLIEIEVEIGRNLDTEISHDTIHNINIEFNIHNNSHYPGRRGLVSYSIVILVLRD